MTSTIGLVVCIVGAIIIGITFIVDIVDGREDPADKRRWDEE